MLAARVLEENWKSSVNRNKFLIFERKRRQQLLAIYDARRRKDEAYAMPSAPEAQRCNFGVGDA